MSEPAIGWISEVVLDGPDPWVLARFWASLLGGTPVEWYPGWVTLEPPPNGQRLSFQATATPLARDTARVHFDILVADLPAAHDQVIAAGATPAGGHAWHLPASPEMPPVSSSGTRRMPGSALSMRKSIKLHTTRS